jgi:hypothetical protein
MSDALGCLISSKDLKLVFHRALSVATSPWRFFSHARHAAVENSSGSCQLIGSLLRQMLSSAGLSLILGRT